MTTTSSVQLLTLLLLLHMSILSYYTLWYPLVLFYPTLSLYLKYSHVPFQVNNYSIVNCLSQTSFLVEPSPGNTSSSPVQSLPHSQQHDTINNNTMIILASSITTGLLLLLVILFVVITSIVCAAVAMRRKQHDKGITAMHMCKHTVLSISTCTSYCRCY